MMPHAGSMPADETQRHRDPTIGPVRPARVEVLGCPIDALTMASTVERCLALVDRGQGATQVSVNAAKLVHCSENAEMRSFVSDCDIVSADGQSVVWASRLLGRPLPERVPGIDLMQELLRVADQRSLSVYILGAREAVLARAVAKLRAEYPGIGSIEARHGYFGPEDEAEVAARIRAASPDVLFVAMDSPRKELWLRRNRDRLGARFAMGVGGAVDVLAGERARAPGWVQRLGLEWLFRLLQEPRRMWRRYLLGNLRFIWLVLRERAGRPSRADAHA